KFILERGHLLNTKNPQAVETVHLNSELVAAFRRFRTIGQLLGSPVYRELKAFLDRLLGNPIVFESPGCRPRLRSFLRVVQWNVQYGIMLDGISRVLNEHPVLRFADLLLINEVDDGMARSGNLSIAAELSRRLRAHAVFGVEYLELAEPAPSDLARDDDAPVDRGKPSKNAASLHGSAILTRHPFSNPGIVRLHRCEDNFASAEKRLGGRAGILADIHLPGVTVAAATAHLDVVNTPQCRQSQMRDLLDALETRCAADSGKLAIVGGDFNTHTFARGGRRRAVINALRILATANRVLSRDLLNPFHKEPLLGDLLASGYRIDGFNDGQPTNQVGARELEASSALPLLVRKLAVRRLGSPEFSLPFRLDWLAARGLFPLDAGEITDPETGASSVAPCTVAGLESAGRRLSDHDPIVVDIRI
ncbi:MAG TPA: endonuclease/exonuclease/phosphatase family protein, partial [Blastocatellia bacterium]